MTTPAEQSLIKDRIEAALEALEDVELLLQHERYRAAANRLYYAAFYAAFAVLLTKKLQFSKHAAVIAFFDKEFIKTGVFPKEYSRSLHRAFHERQNDDYMPFVEFDEEDLNALFEKIKAMVHGINDYLSSLTAE